MLINPRDIKKVSPEPQIPQTAAPKPESPQPQGETQSQFETERL